VRNAADNDVIFRPAWRLDDPEIVQDARRLWSREGVPPALTAQRETELCAASYISGELAAVSTASLFYSPILRNNFFAYRCLVARQFRQHDVAWKISTYSLKLLQNWAAQHATKNRIMGLMTIIETDKFSVGLRKPVREKFGFTMHFVAYTPECHQVRIIWFDDAMLDDSVVKREHGLDY